MKKKPLEYALYLLELRDRTEGEIREKMKRKGYESGEIEDTVTFLKDKDFINDERFVRNFIQNKQSFGTTGKYKIRQKLMLLHLDHTLIEENLKETDPEAERERALELAHDWMKKKSSIPPEKRYEKLGRYLIARGFEIDIVKSILSEVLTRNT